MAAVIGFTIAAAVFCFVAGVILQGRGAPLRRAGITLFALALLPSVAFGVLKEIGVSLNAPGGIAPIALLLGGAFLSLAAYAVLRLQAPTDERPRRIAMKRPFTHRPDRDLLSFLREQMERDE